MFHEQSNFVCSVEVKAESMEDILEFNRRQAWHVYAKVPKEALREKLVVWHIIVAGSGTRAAIKFVQARELGKRRWHAIAHFTGKFSPPWLFCCGRQPQGMVHVQERGCLAPASCGNYRRTFFCRLV